jgi:amino acid adenylation domain-containing protein
MDSTLLSYETLDRKANKLARYLQARGAAPGRRVAICLERSPDMAVALLGVLKSGGAYVPLDPGSPAERLRALFDDSGAAILVTDQKRASELGPWAAAVVCVDADARPIDRESEARPPTTAGASSSDLAYVIYTSGSTGRPKGVAISHRSLVNHASSIVRRFRLGASDRVLQFASLSFDVAAEELYPSWASGACVVLRPPGVPGIEDFERIVAEKRLTVVNLPAGFWHEWVSELARSGSRPAGSLRLVVAGSERVLPERLAWWRSHAGGIEWMNGYGPSEATITASLYADRGGIDIRSSVPIGKPLDNVRFHVVDRHGNVVPLGVAGELWIGGAGVAQGYWNDPERTSESFLADPFGGGQGVRVYRTGDRVRFRSDGNLEFLGRLDEQVKIRGFRIEPGEVEAALERHPDVREAAVIAKGSESDRRLIAYFAPAAAEAAALRAFLKGRLPPYMVPAEYVGLDAMPRTASGKVDRRRLPEPDRDASARGREFLPPTTPIEQGVAAIWSELLRVNRPGVTDNFFDLGGHSLLATQVVSRVREAFGVALPVRVLFEAPTIGELAIAIAQAGAEQASPDDLASLLEELEAEPSAPPSRESGGA